MRILHTSDWHIGQRLYGNERISEQQLFHDWLIQTIEQKRIEALLIAGDIFDVAYPSNSALELYYSFLTRLHTTSCKNVIIIGGNHDSVSTLNAPKKILKHLNIQVFGGLESSIDAHFIEIKNKEKDVVIAAIPFLREKDIVDSLAGQDFYEKIETLKRSLLDFYHKIDVDLNKKYSNHLKIYTGHFYTSGSLLSDSERQIHFGNQGEISFSKLPKADYWALGHIHRPQKIGGNENVRYSGSPLPLSFSERKDNKILIELDIQENGLTINEIDIPKFRELKRIKGTFDEVFQQLGVLENKKPNLKHWIEILVKEDVLDLDKKHEFLNYIAKLENSEVLKYRFETKEAKSKIEKEEIKGVKDMSYKEIFDKLLEKKGIEKSNDLIMAYTQLVEQVLNETGATKNTNN